MRISLVLFAFLFLSGLAWGEEHFKVTFPVPPKALTPFDVEIKALATPAPKKIKASFEMKKMYMGEFKFDAEEKDGVYLLKKVTLPKCMSGEKTWVLVIDYGVGKDEVSFELGE
jgi:hypothetical protein